MNEDTTSTSPFTWLLGGIALGALAMFLLDPEQGNRRRALARDKLYSAGTKARKSMDAASRDLANRAQGMRSEASRMVSDISDSVGSKTLQ